MKLNLYVALVAAICFSTADMAFAQGGPQGGDDSEQGGGGQGGGGQGGGEGGGPPIDEIADALGISADDFESCMSPPPEQGGSRPSREEMEEMEAELASCLQSANSSLSEDEIKEVMEDFRPEPPERE